MSIVVIIIVVMILVLFTVMVIKTLFFKSKQLAPEQSRVEEYQIDTGGATGRLSRAISYKTVFGEGRPMDEKEVFIDFQRFLREAFPKVHQVLQRSVGPAKKKKKQKNKTKQNK